MPSPSTTESPRETIREEQTASLFEPGCPAIQSGHRPIVMCDETAVPQIGLALWRADNATARNAALEAFRAGYRSMDTAAIYHNEKGLGQAVGDARDLLGLKREDLFIATKLWNDAHGYDSTLKAFEASRARLGLEYLDLYLIHWPAPGQNRYLETWKALLHLKREGKVRAIGVCNFLPEHVDRLVAETGQKPALNQVELHPHFQQADLCAAMKKRGIPVEAWAPLGGGLAPNDPLFRKLALKYRKTPAQIVLRWHVENGRLIVPKSAHPYRIRENISIFDFRLDAEDMRQIALLERGHRLGPNPATFR